MPREALCDECKVPFSTILYNKMCCSPECQHQRHLRLRRIRERHVGGREIQCDNCSTVFYTHVARQRFCSTACCAAATSQTSKEAYTARASLARFVLSFMERRMPEQLAKLKTACEEKQSKRAAL